MPLPRLRWRFRLRTMMIATAIVAIVLGVAAELRRRRGHLLRLANEHRDRSIYITVVGQETPGWVVRRAKWNGRMASAYYHVADRPWLYVVPEPLDPPEPPEPPMSE